MEKTENTDDKLYSTAELNKIINKYKELFRFLRRKLGKDFVNDTFGIDNNDSIVDLKRGLVGGSNRIFWDYLCATHSIMKDKIKNGDLQGQFNINDGIGCTKLIFASGKEVIFTTESSLHKHPKGVVSLDNLFYALEKVDGTKEFANISNEIYKMEVTHFKSKSYNDKKDKIMQSSKEKIINICNIESSN